MSVIEQALRRVQEPVLRAAQQATVKAPPPSPPPQTSEPIAHPWPATSQAPQPATATNAVVVAAAAVISFMVVLLVAGVVWFTQIRRTMPSSTTAIATSPPAAGSARSETPPAARAQDSRPPVVAAVPPDMEATSLPARSNPLLLSEIVKLSNPSAPRASETSRPKLVLSGIAGGSGEPYAVINGQIIGVGETIEGYTLVRINDRAATLRSADGRETVLRIPR